MGDLVREVDVAVVGGGPGGYAAAFRAADLGLEAVVIDADGRLGGVCLHEGCIPSKALLHAAALLADVRRAKDMGIEFGEPRVDLAALRAWMRERVVGRLVRGLHGVAKSRGVELIHGRAVFDDARTLRIEGEEPQRVRFRYAVLATGSSPAMPPGLEAGGPRVMDSTSALDLADVPGRLLVIGGGYIGLELGQVYAALGSQVTLVEITDGLLPGVDRDLVHPLARRCQSTFSAIHVGTGVTALRAAADGVEADLAGQGTRAFDRVLVAVGRRPRTAGLGLEVTQVRLDAGGAVEVDERCRTADPHILAVGDVTGGPMLAHRATRQGRVAAEVIGGRPSAFDSVAIPAVVFTDPEIAWCGLGETEATRTGRRVRVLKAAWVASGRAITLGRADGLTKLLIDPDSGRLLGAGIVGPGAGELIAEAALAMEAALTAEDLALTVHAHPTLAETLMEAAESGRP